MQWTINGGIALVAEETVKKIKISKFEKRAIKQKILPRKLAELKELTPETIRETTAGIEKAIRENYVFPEQAEDLCQVLEAHHANGDYSQIADHKTFCEQLTQHLRNVVNDKHLKVMLPEDMPGIISHAVKKPKERDKEELLGLTNVEVLSGNVGYMNINMFQPLFDSMDRLKEAMRVVKNTDALIIDLRKCRGGSGDSANFLLSYFFDSEVALTLLVTYFRPQNHTFKIQTTKTPFKYRKPIYTLTSSFTGSCGEHFAFALKIHKRATLVGTNTAGMAHPCAIIGLDTGILFKVPIGRTYDPETNEDWEGIGVSPDIRCPEDNALIEAKKNIQNVLRFSGKENE